MGLFGRCSIPQNTHSLPLNFIGYLFSFLGPRPKKVSKFDPLKPILEYFPKISSYGVPYFDTQQPRCEELFFTLYRFLWGPMEFKNVVKKFDLIHSLNIYQVNSRCLIYYIV